MNKHIFYIAAACAALASCVKNEVRVDAPDKEITFQTVSTKAGTAFETDKHFFSYAYFLEKDKTWDPDFASAKPYIDNALITYKPGTSAGEGFWVAGKTYYWPKQGSLTFFAWTDNTIHNTTSNPAPSVGTGATVSCAPNTGIKIENYSVKDNPNKDILVADIAKNKTANETQASTAWENGVLTVFRHALASVEFKVNKRINYTDVKFKVKSITLNNVYTKGTFTQGSPTESKSWSDWAEPAASIPVFTNAAGLEVTKTADATATNKGFDILTPATDDYKIVLPQTFDATSTSELTIVYDIITNYTGTPVTETVTETKKLNGIYTSNWESGKKYILGITLGLNEIYWDPSVEGWENGDVTDIQF